MSSHLSRRERESAETIQIDTYEPNYRRKCGACGTSPTVEGVKDGARVVIADLCGPCTFGTSDAIEPSEWNRLF